MGHYDRLQERAEVKMQKSKRFPFFWILAVLFLFPPGAVTGQEAVKTSKKSEHPVPKSKLDNLKTEWEAVREQQVQMIREKEDRLEKLKEEIFSKMKDLNKPAVSNGNPGFEAQKAALQTERQKFFAEMSRQKESLQRLQSAFDKKVKQFEAERDRFEQKKKTAAR